MEAGQSNNIAFIIQARMQSARLPGKVLLPLPFGSDKTILDHIIDTLRQTIYGDKIIIATSINPENEHIVSFAVDKQVECFKGSEEDVLSRFISICEMGRYDHVVRLTADNPIIDTDSLNEVIKHHITQKNDYTGTKGLPLGMNLEVIKTTALFDSLNYELSDDDREHVTLFLRNNGKYKKEIYSYNTMLTSANIRLTIDYLSDYLLVSSLFSWSYAYGKILNLKLLEELFISFPWLFEGNNENIQKKQFSSFNEEIEAAINILNRYDMKRVSKVLTDKNGI